MPLRICVYRNRWRGRAPAAPAPQRTGLPDTRPSAPLLENLAELRPAGLARTASAVPRGLQKGGVPAAPSGTATLLRLSPSHLFYPRALLYRRRTSGPPGSHGLTGGVYKARERIHRAMADARLLANPASRSRVADSGPNWEGVSRLEARRRAPALCPPHCNTCVAPDVRAVLI